MTEPERRRAGIAPGGTPETLPLLQGFDTEAYEGFFITLEGVEGCGKTTQSELLASRLADDGYDVLRTREPGGTDIGAEIRALLLRAPRRLSSHATEITEAKNRVSASEVWWPTNISDRTEALLYAASRSQHVTEVIMPALRSGKVVVCDRFIDSSLAYQGMGRGLGFEYILGLHELSSMGLMPDLTVVLSIDLSRALSRIDTQGPDRIETEREVFHARVQEAFDSIVLMYPERVTPVSGEGTIEEVATAVYQTVAGRMLDRLLD